MRQYLTTADISNTVSMLRTGFDGTILVVEGVTDSRLYGKFVDRDKVRIVVAHSKDKVRSSVDLVFNRRDDHRVIGIVDSDLDRLKHKGPKDPVFMTDCRDAESMMISSDALEDVLAEYADTGRLTSFESRFGPIRDRIRGGAYPLGLLMYVSDSNGLGLSFKSLDFRSFIDRRSLECDVGAMIRESITNTASDRVSERYVSRLLEAEMEKGHDVWDVCRGHDLVNVLLIGLRDNFGAENAKHLKEGELGGALRLAYDDDVFAKTELYRDSKSWCDRIGMPLWKIR